MADEVVYGALVSVTTKAEGNVELDTIKSISVDEDDEKAAVETMNRDNVAIGYTRGVQKTTFEIEEVVLAGGNPIDWRRLKVNFEKFGMTYAERDNGDRYALVDCVVDKISTPYSSGGDTMRKISGKALRHRKNT